MELIISHSMRSPPLLAETTYMTTHKAICKNKPVRGNNEGRGDKVHSGVHWFRSAPYKRVLIYSCVTVYERIQGGTPHCKEGMAFQDVFIPIQLHSVVGSNKAVGDFKSVGRDYNLFTVPFGEAQKASGKLCSLVSPCQQCLDNSDRSSERKTQHWL